jgi:hypothetical protein
MLSNAGGAKGPDFWCAFEDGEVEVIGEEPANTSRRAARAPLASRNFVSRRSTTNIRW